MCRRSTTFQILTNTTFQCSPYFFYSQWLGRAWGPCPLGCQSRTQHTGQRRHSKGRIRHLLGKIFQHRLRSFAWQPRNPDHGERFPTWSRPTPTPTSATAITSSLQQQQQPHIGHQHRSVQAAIILHISTFAIKSEDCISHVTFQEFWHISSVNFFHDSIPVPTQRIGWEEKKPNFGNRLLTNCVPHRIITQGLFARYLDF